MQIDATFLYPWHTAPGQPVLAEIVPPFHLVLWGHPGLVQMCSGGWGDISDGWWYIEGGGDLRVKFGTELHYFFWGPDAGTDGLATRMWENLICGWCRSRRMMCGPGWMGQGCSQGENLKEKLNISDPPDLVMKTVSMDISTVLQKEKPLLSLVNYSQLSN